jgi:hypothetical protein
MGAFDSARAVALTHIRLSKSRDNNSPFPRTMTLFCVGSWVTAAVAKDGSGATRLGHQQQARLLAPKPETSVQ